MNTSTKTRLRKELVGIVVSDKMDKTVIVRADRRMSHPQYQKVILISKKFVAHDEKNEAKTGDIVRINQTRPLSKTKRWVVVGTVSKNTKLAVEKKSESSQKESVKTKARAKAKTAAKRKKS